MLQKVGRSQLLYGRSEKRPIGVQACSQGRGADLPAELLDVGRGPELERSLYFVDAGGAGSEQGQCDSVQEERI